ncbi:MAG TPA: secretin N-terminal domain-containing protein [Tepidisphaeraceae bacterium]|jgi:general secretion pathway protein D|nr:secretin N-terminal domain-containing protein [Tepidisphaeraceae bacterium]
MPKPSFSAGPDCGAARRAIVLAAVMGLGIDALSARFSAQAADPPAAATRPAEAAAIRLPPATRPAQPADKKISLNFKDAPLDVVLDHLADAAGLIIVKEGQVDGRVTVQSVEPVTPEEAVTLLNTVLKANGFAAAQEGRVVRIAARDKMRKGAMPVHVGADPKEIAATDELITQVIPLKNVEALRLRQDLAPLIGPDADITANESSNSIVITDSSASIRRLVEVIGAMDVDQTSSTELRVIQLKYADAEATAKLIMSVLRPSDGAGGGQMNPQMRMMMQQQQQQGGPPAGGAGAEGRIPGGAIDQALRSGHVHADADPRTNTLIVTAPAAAMKVIEEDIIKRLDSNPVPASQLKAFKLNYADAEATSKLLGNLYKPNADRGGYPFFNPFGMMPEQSAHAKIEITFDARTNAVIVSAPAEVLASIGDLIKDLDSSPGTGSELRTFTLKNADAYDAAKMITSIFQPDEKDNGASSLRMILFGIPPSAAKGAKVVATSDDRTNTLVVTAPKEAMKAIEDLVTKLDTNTTAGESLFIYRLRNAQAANLEQVLNTLFGNTTSGQNQGQNPNQGGQPNGQQANQQNFGNRQVGNQSGANQAGGTGIGARHGTRNDQTNNQRNMPHMPSNLSQAINEMTGEVFVVADVDTNSLIVTTASKYRDTVRDIIKELDRPAPQVLIKVLVAEVTHDNAADWGTDFSVLNRRPNGNGDVVAQTLGNGAAAAANGGLIATVVENNLSVTLHALATEGKLDVLSRPYILASDNQQASITVGQEVPFITNTQLTDTGQTINTIQYQDVGIILNVTPHINPEGLVILDVSPEISQITGTTVPISAGVAAPIIAKRSADSRVAIRDGQTIVIGGMMQDQKTSTVSKVPLLGDIPLLGELFRRTQVDKTKTELLIFLTPHVAQEPDSLGGMSGDELKGTHLTPGAVSPGMFDEHLRGMDRGASTRTSPRPDPAATQPVKIIRGEQAP